MEILVIVKMCIVLIKMHHSTDTKSKNFPGNWPNEVPPPQKVIYMGDLWEIHQDIKATDSR